MLVTFVGKTWTCFVLIRPGRVQRKWNSAVSSDCGGAFSFATFDGRRQSEPSEVAVPGVSPYDVVGRLLTVASWGRLTAPSM